MTLYKKVDKIQIINKNTEMNDSFLQSFSSRSTQFIIEYQNVSQFNPQKFESDLYSFLVKEIYEPVTIKKMESENFPQIIAKTFTQFNESRFSQFIEKTSIKPQLVSIDIKNVVNQIQKIQSKLKYPLALNIILLLTLNKQKSLSIIFGFYYQMLNNFIKELKKQNYQSTKTGNKKNNEEQTCKNQKIHQFCSLWMLRIFQVLTKFCNSSKEKTCIRPEKNQSLGCQILRIHLQNSNNMKSFSSIFKTSKVYKIVSSLLCLVQSHLPVNQLLQGLSKLKEHHPNSNEIFQKVEYKLVNKFQQYNKKEFGQKEVIIMLKIIFHSINPKANQIFQYLFQSHSSAQSDLSLTKSKTHFSQNQSEPKTPYFQNKKQAISKLFDLLSESTSFSTQKLNQQTIKKAPSTSFGYHLTCFIIKIISKHSLLKNKNQKQNSSFIRQLVFYIATEFLHKIYGSSSNKKNIKFYNTIIQTLISQSDIFILKVCLDFVQNQTILSFSVHKLKSLFKLLTDIAKKLKRMECIGTNKSSNSIKSQKQSFEDSNLNEKQTQKIKQQEIQLNQQVQLSKLKISRILRIIDQLSQRFQDKSPEILFQSGNQSFLHLEKVKSSNAFFFHIRVNDRRKTDFKVKGFQFQGKNRIQHQSNDQILLVRFILGKSQTYEAFVCIKCIGMQKNDVLNNKKEQLKSEKSQEQNSIGFLDEISSKDHLSYTADILIYQDKKLLIKQQLKNIQKVANSYFEFILCVSCNKPIDTKGTNLLIKVNEKLIKIPSKQKRNEITSLQVGPLFDKSSSLMNSVTCLIKNLYLFNKQIPENLINKNDFSLMSFSINTLLQFIGSNESITYKISTSSEKLIENFKKQDSLFFKKQLKITKSFIQKRRSISFIQIFQQIGGLNSIFYILQKINKSYATHFGQKTQYFFIELFKILRNVGSNDRQNFVFKELKNSYSYIFHFLILIFKRNEHLANQRNSLFVEAIFKFIMFFSTNFTKNEALKQYSLEEVLEMQLTFIKEVLCNFQLWSECSIEIQSYVFETLQGFIKNERYTYVLFPIDLHSKILSSLTFFYSQQTLNILKNKFEQRILLLCQILYDKVTIMLYDEKNNLENTYNLELLFNLLKKIVAKQSKEDFSFISEQRQKSQKQKGQNKEVTTRKDLITLFERYVHRDINETIGMINLLLIYHKKHFTETSSNHEKDLLAQNNSTLKHQKQNLKLSTITLSDTKKSFAPALSSGIASNVYLPAALRTCSNLISYFLKNFVQKDQIFSKVNEDWGYILGILTQFQETLLETKIKLKQNSSNNKSQRISNSCQFFIMSKIFNLLFKIVSKKKSFFNYVLNSLDRVLKINGLSFLEIFEIASQIISLNKKFNFDIVQTVFFLLNKRFDNLRDTNNMGEMVEFFSQNDLEKILYKMADVSLTQSKQFQDFVEKINKEINLLPDTLFNSQQIFQPHVTITDSIKVEQKVQNHLQQSPVKKDQLSISEILTTLQILKNQNNQSKTPTKINSQLKIPKSKNQLKKVFLNYQDVLFSICYETGSILKQNRQWIQTYFSQKYQKLKNKDSIQKQNLLKQKRINIESNLLIAYFCSTQATVNFMFDALERNALQQIQDLKDQERFLLNRNIQQLVTIKQNSPRKEVTNSYTSKLSEKPFSKQDLFVENEDKINKQIQNLLNLSEPISFFLSNPKLSFSQIVTFGAFLQQKLNERLQSYSLLKNSTISLLTFIRFYLIGYALNYILEKYSYIKSNVTQIQRPIDAIKRKQETIQALNFIAKSISNKLFETQGFYNCLLSENQINTFKNQKEIVFDKDNLSDQKKTKLQKEIQQNLKKFIQSWYTDSTKSFRINLHDKSQIKSPKKLNLEQKFLYDTFFEKIKFICFQNQNEDQKINQLFAFMTQNTQGNQTKQFLSLLNRMTFTLKYIIESKYLLCLLQNSSLFNKQLFPISCPKNPAQILTKKIVSQYREQVTVRFNKILQVERQKGEKSQKEYRKNEKENQFWLQIEEKEFERKDMIYEIDEKQMGPFGFYKLNIKPSQERVEQIHYPRKKMFASIKQSEESQQNEQQQNNEIEESILLNRTRLIQMSMDNNYLEERQQRRNTLLQISPNKNNSEKVMEKNSVSNNNLTDNTSTQLYCEWVTKRGVYAGKIVIKKQSIEFKYLSHLKLPSDPVFKLSTGKFHQINSITQEQKSFISSLKIPFKRCRMFTRRYIMRHTAVEIFSKINHQSYFFNLFFQSQREKFVQITRQKFEECLQDRKQQFMRKNFTQQWQIGQISNFEYLCLINQYSGRSTNDLAQYYVFPWVITNYNGKNGYKQIDQNFYMKPQNMRDLSCPPGKLSEEKFTKLKMRLMELDFCEPQERFLYGTMFSNPTVLYNFFIRLEPYIHLHWEHQGKRIDHADRLFFSIEEQFASVLTASSDMKQLTPQFYYWPEFLKNRSYIDLGLKQNKQQVDDVILPIWAHTPEQFIFKMRYALQSNVVSQHLHQWIDLTFGFKIKYQNAQKYDNLYHFNCYERENDYFEEFDGDQKQIRSLQVSISQFGQVPEAVFDEPHPQKNIRHQFLIIDRVIYVKCERPNSSSKSADQNYKRGFQTCKEGLFVWTSSSVEFKKSYITQNYSYDEDHRVFTSIGEHARLLSFEDQCWLTLNQGVLRIYLKRMLKYESNIQAQCIEVIGAYFIYSKKSSLFVGQYDGVINKLNNRKTLFGHKDEIIYLTCSKQLDLILSVDLQGFVIVHELQNLSFLRNFQLPVEKEWLRNDLQKQSSKQNMLKVQIHQMGYFIFLLNQKKLVVMTYHFINQTRFIGQKFLEHDIQIISSETKGKRQEQKINDLLIFRQDQSILLLGTDKGNIYEIDFIEIKRYNEIFPHKTFTNIRNNILQLILEQHQSFVKKSQVSKKSSQIENIARPIYRMTIQKIPGDKISLYQLIVQYEDGQILCFYEEKYLGKQLRQNEKLKQIGLFF